jgi:hypothetical protein
MHLNSRLKIIWILILVYFVYKLFIINHHLFKIIFSKYIINIGENKEIKPGDIILLFICTVMNCIIFLFDVILSVGEILEFSIFKLKNKKQLNVIFYLNGFILFLFSVLQIKLYFKNKDKLDKGIFSNTGVEFAIFSTALFSIITSIFYIIINKILTVNQCTAEILENQKIFQFRQSLIIFLKKLN